MNLNIKQYLWIILLVTLFLETDLRAAPQVIDWKNLSDTPLYKANLFIDKDNKVFVTTGYSFWINNKQIKTNQYGDFTNGFIKDGKVYLAFRADENDINIFAVENNFVLEKRVTVGNYYKFPIIYGNNNSFYILSIRSQLSSNPLDALRFYLSGGHGILYRKPVLAEIYDQKPLRYHKIPYGGKTNESYLIRETLTEGDTISFIGLITQEQIYKRYLEDVPDILHYSKYNLKKNKVVVSQDIFTAIPRFDNNDIRRRFYCCISADNYGDNIFTVFSWHGKFYSRNVPVLIKIENIDCPIYYSQNNGKGFGNAEIIGKGILPVVRVDSLGNVHAIWSDSNGNVIHKLKKNNKWCEEHIILSGLIDTDKEWQTGFPYNELIKNMCAEFDKNNNLNLVFTSKGKLVYAKIKLD